MKSETRTACEASWRNSWRVGISLLVEPALTGAVLAMAGKSTTKAREILARVGRVLDEIDREEAEEMKETGS